MVSMARLIILVRSAWSGRTDFIHLGRLGLASSGSHANLVLERLKYKHLLDCVCLYMTETGCVLSAGVPGPCLVPGFLTRTVHKLMWRPLGFQGQRATSQTSSIGFSILATMTATMYQTHTHRLTHMGIHVNTHTRAHTEHVETSAGLVWMSVVSPPQRAALHPGPIRPPLITCSHPRLIMRVHRKTGTVLLTLMDKVA